MYHPTLQATYCIQSDANEQMTRSMPAEAYEWLLQVQTNLSPTILFPEASRLNVSKRIRHEEKLTGDLFHPLPTPPWGQPSKMIFQGQDFSLRICHVCLYLSVSPTPTPLLVLLAASPPCVPFLFSLSVSGRVVKYIEMKVWWEGWGCISTKRQRWKVMCSDKTSQWCFCVELGCLYYVLPPRRCLMRYPAGLWVVTEIGLIDFPTLHNARLC